MLKSLIFAVGIWAFVLVMSSCEPVSELNTRKVIDLTTWKFLKGDAHEARQISFNDNDWELVSVPHDWAIKGPFDKEIDKQSVKIIQNNEAVATEKTGRTGALPFVGVGWYRTQIDLDDLDKKRILLVFDGAMSNAEVFVNGQKVGERPYGYSYFYFDITDQLESNKSNVIAVRLENLPFASRWYPGAGLYRKVQLIIKNEISFDHWGHTITTPEINSNSAIVNIKSKARGENLKLQTIIKNSQGFVVVRSDKSDFDDEIAEQNVTVQDPELWNTESPHLYTAEISLWHGEELIDEEKIKFGIREIAYSPQNGFELNGRTTKFKGVCLHHDLGPLGTAVNTAALRRQMMILKDLGCNAIRSAHNMPSMEQLELADELGFLFLAESFDEWKKPKIKNGYNLYFDDWAEKDIVNLVRATRNHPSIVMWSAGNEVPDQWGDDGVKRMKWIQDIFHREDPTRPVTIGMDQVKAVMENGFGAIPDIPGLNYRVHLYDEAFETFPQGLLLGSETASTVSSRGIYKFPVTSGFNKTYDDLQSTSYDLEYCSWSNLPEDDFVVQDDEPWVIGEFVWTGFDYLGEPTPYDDYWPSRSSYFGLVDLAGIPKDRYYLYRSRWNTEEETLHMLPHWNWSGREGEITPVFVYTSYDSAELFVNGLSQGIRSKSNTSKLERYRLMWNDVIYQPGEIEVVGFKNGMSAARKKTLTAGKPHHLELEADRSQLKSDGKDLSFVTVTIVDKDGNLVPNAGNQLTFEVSGNGSFKAVCNGDPTSLEMFHKPTMKAFSGKLVVLIQSAKVAGEIKLKVSANELEDAMINLESR